jgi:hypothetical protein
LGGPHIVFVTSGTFAGDQVSDDRCAEAAELAGLAAGGRAFRAWISYPDASVSSRIADYGPWELRNDGGRVAAHASTLIPAIETPIDVDEYGTSVTLAPNTWTGTESNGGISGYNCNGWTDGTSSGFGNMGNAQANDVSWTSFTYGPCTQRLRLYCFEQPSGAGP